nr:MAG TPA: hypothetical protein [Caudoviricetes sp.]
MNEMHVNVSLPFTNDELEKYFDDIESYFFHIDLDRSKYTGHKLLTYIYNSGMRANIESTGYSEQLDELLIEYIRSDRIIDISSLNELWTQIILKRIGIIKYTDNTDLSRYIDKFVKCNGELVDEIILAISSLKRFFMEISNNDDIDHSTFTSSFEQVGLNFISLRNGMFFWTIFGALPAAESYQYEEFIKPVFNGKRIAGIFREEFNPIGMLYMIQQMTDDDVKKVVTILEGVHSEK